MAVILDLATWRRDVAHLSLEQAARRAGISQSQAADIERRPHSASAGALASYIRALGGSVSIELNHAGTRYQLSLLVAVARGDNRGRAV